MRSRQRVLSGSGTGAARVLRPTNADPESALASGVPWLVTALLFACTIAAFYPGYLSFDSAYQYWQARTGNFSNQSPPAMTALWSAIDRLWPGSGGMFVGQIALYWLGVGLLAQLLFRTATARSAAVILVGLVSPALPIVVHLWTDAALISALAGATALTLLGGRKRGRLALLLALPLLVYAGQVRHNAIAAVLPLFALWAGAWRRTADRPQSAVGWRFALATTIALLVLTVATERILDRMLVRERVPMATLVMLWDLAGISVGAQQNLIPPFAPHSGRITVPELRERYSPYTNVTLHVGPTGLLRDRGYSDLERADIRRRWLAAIAAHPEEYLDHRLAIAARLFGRYPDERPATFAYLREAVSYRDNPPIALNSSRLNRLASDLYATTLRWWISAPVAYVGLALACVILAWQRRDTDLGRFCLALASSGLFYVAPLVLIAPSADLRYCGWLFLSALFGCAALLAAVTGRGDAPAEPGR